MKKRLLLRYGLLIAAISVSGGLLLHTSQSVQRAENDMHALKTAIERERQTIDVLEAEWAFLNSPYRLERLAAQYLGMVPSEASYIVPDLNILNEDAASGIENAVMDDVPVQVPAEGVHHISNSSAKKPEQPVQVQKSVNGNAEDGFDDLISRLGGGR